MNKQSLFIKHFNRQTVTKRYIQEEEHKYEN